MQNIAGLLVSLLYVGAVLGASALLAAKAGWGREATRKFAHIALGGWWVVAMLFFTTPLWAALPPALFVLVNGLAYYKGGLPFLQREKDDSPGTVYYAASLLLLALFCFGPAQPWLGAAGVFCMALGDGLAAVLGRRFGRRRFTLAGGVKSLVGTSVMLAACFAVCLAVQLIFLPSTPAGLAVLYALALAGTATMAEALAPNGLDNLTVPLAVSALFYLLQNPGGAFAAPLLGGLLSLAVVLLAWSQNLLTGPGGIGAVLVGGALYALGGWALWCLLIWFFASANLATRLFTRGKGAEHKKGHSPRRLRQVLANSVPALLCAAAYRGAGGWFLVVSAGALAACTADTWASEIGVHAKRDPVNILTLRPMARGLSGGVSPLGLGASVVGAFSTALLAMLLFHTMDPALPTGPSAFFLVAGCGVAGSLLDSVLGVCLQAKYSCAGMDSLLEAPHGEYTCTLVSGVRWMTNDMVNLLSGSLVVVLALPAAVF